MLHLTCCILHVASYMLHLKCYILHVASYMLYSSRCILHVASYTLHLTPCILHVASYMLHLKRCILNVASYSLHLTCCILQTKTKNKAAIKQKFMHKKLNRHFLSCLLISLGQDSSLITKVSLHTFPPSDPPFSPPQTFSQLKAMEKGKTFQEDTCLSYMVFPPPFHPLPRVWWTLFYPYFPNIEFESFGTSGRCCSRSTLGCRLATTLVATIFTVIFFPPPFFFPFLRCHLNSQLGLNPPLPSDISDFFEFQTFEVCEFRYVLVW